MDQLQVAPQAMFRRVYVAPQAMFRRRLADFEGQLDSAITINRNARQIGSPDPVASIGRKLRQHDVATVGLREYIEPVGRKYDKHQNNGERFAVWVNRAEEGEGDLT